MVAAGSAQEWAMHHVMLVEPDDDFCLFPCDAIVQAGCRMTIVGSVAEATAALSSPNAVDHVVTEAQLPDGSGLVLAQDVRRPGKSVFVLRKRRGRVVVYDRENSVFVGDQAGVGAFLAKALLARGTTPTRVAKAGSDLRRGRAETRKR
jgi:CheY-like chemotaxis protein